jgi:hypothetical protein
MPLTRAIQTMQGEISKGPNRLTHFNPQSKESDETFGGGTSPCGGWCTDRNGVRSQSAAERLSVPWSKAELFVEPLCTGRHGNVEHVPVGVPGKGESACRPCRASAG